MVIGETIGRRLQEPSEDNIAPSRIAAISEAFKIVNTNVLEAVQRKQLQAIRAHLDSLEDGGAQVIDV